jgi:hypothetical protein
MGRTVPTFTQVIEQEMQSWSKFRRGLRREDQEMLDDLFRAARMQLAGSAYAARPIPFDSVVMSMLLAQQRMIRKLEERLRHCEREDQEEVAVQYDHADDHRMAV